MTLDDQIAEEDIKKDIRTEQKNLREKKRQAKIQQLITMSFRHAAEDKREIARAVANKYPYRVAIDGMPPVHTLSDLAKYFVSFPLNAMRVFKHMPFPLDIKTPQIECNAAYRDFKEAVRKQGLEATSLKTESSIVRGACHSVAVITLERR